VLPARKRAQEKPDAKCGKKAFLPHFASGFSCARLRAHLSSREGGSFAGTPDSQEKIKKCGQ